MKSTTILGSIVALGGFAWLASPKRSRASSSTKAPAKSTTHRPTIVFTRNCNWDIPDSW